MDNEMAFQSTRFSLYSDTMGIHPQEGKTGSFVSNIVLYLYHCQHSSSTVWYRQQVVQMDGKPFDSILLIQLVQLDEEKFQVSPLQWPKGSTILIILQIYRNFQPNLAFIYNINTQQTKKTKYTFPINLQWCVKNGKFRTKALSKQNNFKQVNKNKKM